MGGQTIKGPAEGGDCYIGYRAESSAELRGSRYHVVSRSCPRQLLRDAEVVSHVATAQMTMTSSAITMIDHIG